jgi:hypothetical protein
MTEQGGLTRDATRSDYSNQFYFFDGMLAVTGIALHNEGVDDSLVLTYLNKFDGDLHNHMIPTVNQVGGKKGGWHEGLGYATRALTTFSLAIEVWRLGAGEDVFPQVDGLKEVGRWILYSTQPDGAVSNIGDVSGWPVGWGQSHARLACLLASRYKDRLSQKIAAAVDPTRGGNWPYAVFFLLWHDPGIAPVDYAELDPSEHFDGIGWVSMRSGWTSNDVFAMFHSGNYYFGHQHHDQNSFTIHRSAPLAIDNGKYNVGPPLYKTATRFHNTILVGDPGEDGSNSDGTAGQTGASPMYLLSDPENSLSNKGDIVRYDRQPDFIYVVGDAGKAYSPARLNSFTRKFLYIMPNRFIVFDRVTTPTTRYPVRWMLQAITTPSLSGHDVTITNGGGRLFVKTLLPKNPVFMSSVLFPGMSKYGGGNYRVTISPTVPNTTEYFLTLFVAEKATVSFVPQAAAIESSSGSLAGIHIADVVALFVKDNSASLEESYSVTYEGTLKHFVCDLDPNGTYDIFQDGAKVLRVSASSGGTLQFSTDSGGDFKISRISP